MFHLLVLAQSLQRHIETRSTGGRPRPESVAAIHVHEKQASRPIFPVLHVHVSGSAGTTFCSLGRRQHSVSGRAAGRAFACNLPCKGNLDWRAIALPPWSSRPCGRSLVGSCEALEATMAQRGFHVLGAMETVLPEANRSHSSQALANAITPADLAHGSLHKAAWCRDYKQTNGMLVVTRGSTSPYDMIYPLSGWQVTLHLVASVLLRCPPLT